MEDLFVNRNSAKYKTNTKYSLPYDMKEILLVIKNDAPLLHASMQVGDTSHNTDRPVNSIRSQKSDCLIHSARLDKKS